MAFDASIDPMRLDYEWVRQPALYHEYSVKVAEARRDADRAKAKVDVAKAEAELDIRANPKEYGHEKVTEALVTALVAVHPQVKAAVRSHLDAKHDADILQAAVNALDHKKRALENLVELHGRDYFSQPVAHSPAGREAMGEATKTAARRRTQRQRDDTEE